MAETLVENKVCEACGADVREGALFCYHCGGAVEAEVAVSAANGDSVSSGWFRENIAEEDVKIKEAEKSKVTAKLETKDAEKNDASVEKTVDLPIEKPSDALFDAPVEKPKVQEERNLKSAAAMRRQAKILQKKRVEEVIWEEHENAPNGWFMAIALILILIAGTFFYLAVYIK